MMNDRLISKLFHIWYTFYLIHKKDIYDFEFEFEKYFSKRYTTNICIIKIECALELLFFLIKFIVSPMLLFRERDCADFNFYNCSMYYILCAATIMWACKHSLNQWKYQDSSVIFFNFISHKCDCATTNWVNQINPSIGENNLDYHSD
jgi:hypothetical protein